MVSPLKSHIQWQAPLVKEEEIPKVSSDSIVPASIGELSYLIVRIVTLPFRLIKEIAMWIYQRGKEFLSTIYHTVFSSSIRAQYKALCSLQEKRVALFPDPTQVRFEDNPQFNFNAHWALPTSEGEKTSFQAIVSEGPLQENVKHFLEMIWKTNTDVIVSFPDQERTPYWKALPEKGFFSRMWKKEEVSVLRKSSPEGLRLRGIKAREPVRVLYQDKSCRILRRSIVLSLGDQRKYVTQFQLEGSSKKSSLSAEFLAKLVQEVWSDHCSTQPLLVHASKDNESQVAAFLTVYEALQRQTTDIFPIAEELCNPLKGKVSLLPSQDEYLLASEAARLVASQE